MAPIAPSDEHFADDLRRSSINQHSGPTKRLFQEQLDMAAKPALKQVEDVAIALIN